MTAGYVNLATWLMFLNLRMYMYILNHAPPTKGLFQVGFVAQW